MTHVSTMWLHWSQNHYQHIKLLKVQPSLGLWQLHVLVLQGTLRSSTSFYWRPPPSFPSRSWFQQGLFPCCFGWRVVSVMVFRSLSCLSWSSFSCQSWVVARGPLDYLECFNLSLTSPSLLVAVIFTNSLCSDGDTVLTTWPRHRQ